MLAFRGGGFRRVECTKPRPSAPESATEVYVLLTAVVGRLFRCSGGRFRRDRLRGLLRRSFNMRPRTSGPRLSYYGWGLLKECRRGRVLRRGVLRGGDGFQWRLDRGL